MRCSARVTSAASCITSGSQRAGRPNVCVCVYLQPWIYGEAASCGVHAGHVLNVVYFLQKQLITLIPGSPHTHAEKNHSLTVLHAEKYSCPLSLIHTHTHTLLQIWTPQLPLKLAWHSSILLPLNFIPEILLAYL